MLIVLALTLLVVAEIIVQFTQTWQDTFPRCLQIGIFLQTYVQKKVYTMNVLFGQELFSLKLGQFADFCNESVKLGIHVEVLK